MAEKLLSLTLLVPLDGSALAEQALPYARMLATLAPTTIHLLHVISPSTVDRRTRAEETLLGAAGDDLETHSVQVARMGDQMREDAERYLEQQARLISGTQCTVEHQVVFGPVADEIAAAAERIRSNIVVMATHGAGGLMRWALGSVTTKVLRKTQRPVMVIRGMEKPVEYVRMPRRIMIALDGSALAERALPMATNLARMTGAELLLTEVIESYDAPFAVFNGPEALTHMREMSFNYLNHVADNLRTDTGRHITTTVPVGHIAEALLEEATRKDIELIVLGRHGIGGAHATFLGGTADKLTQASNLPLLITS